MRDATILPGDTLVICPKFYSKDNRVLGEILKCPCGGNFLNFFHPLLNM